LGAHPYGAQPWSPEDIDGKEVSIQMTSLYLRVMELLDRDEEGQGFAEYALILALIAIVAIIALIFLGSQVSKILSTVGKSV
jgi:Flp pilus assembly pilin Flp